MDDSYPKNLDFRCKDLIFSNNTIEACSNVAFMIQSGLKDGGLFSLTGGKVALGEYHALFGDPRPGERYSVKIGADVVWIGTDRRPEKLPIWWQPIHPEVKFL